MKSYYYYSCFFLGQHSIVLVNIVASQIQKIQGSNPVMALVIYVWLFPTLRVRWCPKKCQYCVSNDASNEHSVSMAAAISLIRMCS